MPWVYTYSQFVRLYTLITCSFFPSKSQCKKVVLSKYKLILKSPKKKKVLLSLGPHMLAEKNVHVLKKINKNSFMVYETNIESLSIRVSSWL